MTRGLTLLLLAAGCATPPDADAVDLTSLPETLSIANLDGPAVVIDVDAHVTFDEIKRWEAAHGRIPNGAVLLFRTRRNRAAPVTIEAAEYLVTYRNLVAVGNIGDEARATFLAKGVSVLEGVANLERLPPTGARVAVTQERRLVAHVPKRRDEKPAPVRRKFLIEFGWDIPDAKTLATAARAGTPFDGAVIDPDRFSWRAWGKESVDDAWVRRVIDDLAATPAEFRSHSFIRFNVTPGDVGWDAFDGVLANARAAARIVREGGLAGILFDVEHYQKKVFEGKESDTARKRGVELGAAWAGLEVLLTYGYSLAWGEYALLAPFLDGLRKEAVVIDGYEYAYPFKERAAFEKARDEIARKGLGVSFGIWIDWDSGKRGWDEKDSSKNWFTPETFGGAVRHALALCDKYVWIYSERLNWWAREHLPDAYVRALADAKR